MIEAPSLAPLVAKLDPLLVILGACYALHLFRLKCLFCACVLADTRVDLAPLEEGHVAADMVC